MPQVIVGADGATQINNVPDNTGGTVSVQGKDPNATQVSLGPGQSTRITPGQPPLPPTAMNLSLNLGAQQAVAGSAQDTQGGGTDRQQQRQQQQQQARQAVAQAQVGLVDAAAELARLTQQEQQLVQSIVTMLTPTAVPLAIASPTRTPPPVPTVPVGQPTLTPPPTVLPPPTLTPPSTPIVPPYLSGGRAAAGADWATAGRPRHFHDDDGRGAQPHVYRGMARRALHRQREYGKLRGATGRGHQPHLLRVQRERRRGRQRHERHPAGHRHDGDPGQLRSARAYQRTRHPVRAR